MTVPAANGNPAQLLRVLGLWLLVMKTGVPKNNVILVGVLAFIGAFALNYQLRAELLNSVRLSVSWA